jgi:hypothetical protein
MSESRHNRSFQVEDAEQPSDVSCQGQSEGTFHAGIPCGTISPHKIQIESSTSGNKLGPTWAYELRRCWLSYSGL